MPVIQLATDGNDHHKILAHMYAPDDEERRAAVFADLKASPTVPPYTSVPTPGEGRRLLQLSDLIWRASMAGEVLVRVACMKRAGITEPSVRKAIWSLSNHAIALRSDEDGQQLEERPFNKIPTDEKSFWNYWSDYKTVVHFWAAHRVFETEVPFFEIPDALASDPHLRTFLGWSEWFLEFGSTYTSRDDKAGPLLEVQVSWVAEPRVEAIEPDLEYAIQGVLEDLRKYRAH